MIDNDFMSFIYIDKEEIENIYCQISNRPVEYKVSISNQIDGSINGELKSSGLTKSVLDAGVGANVGGKHEITREQTVPVNYVNKAKLIYEVFFKARTETLADACNHDADSKWIACKAIFRLKGAFDEIARNWVNASDIRLNPYKYDELCFNFGTTQRLIESSNRQILHDAELDKHTVYVDMMLSSKKLIRGIRHITQETRYDTDFMFYIIGELTYKVNNNYCLKPFAIWRSSNKNI